MLLRPRRDEKEVDVGASSVGIVELILYIDVAMPGVRLPRKIVRNIHKSHSAARHVVRPISACLAEIELVSFNRSSIRIHARWPAVLSKVRFVLTKSRRSIISFALTIRVC